MNFQDIHDFWFTRLQPEQWWKKDAAVDSYITANFQTLHQQANRGELFQWRESAKGRLAEIILLDQFSRNMFRDSDRAFASDSLALVLAQEAIAKGVDQELSAIERSFMYMPFMHSESLFIHDQALQLFTENGLQSTLDFEVMHRNIIAKFGRYPHRNAILQRTSTPEELAFLRQPNSSF
ncbi:DUF924 family protein [Psychromonas sp. 14N.309.X.WAT.B.A12]|jgi:uncharacterized protein (DUF924 family)|uniref:DUF924 family protein n=1 Tax=unclassified Psychromonas TaxID=2614957 RepID=UPI0025B137AD|nr:DUF924 family protein [Psychromonas sp. 14N.309.X.WAT.B.A12]MDN2663059.1 DUF924 domain-containing protein [Psychromonas sp. 14N.309.X.WAT.B.A12]